VNITALIDAIAADLDTLALPEHRVARYFDPPLPSSDRGPLLAVFIRDESFESLNTAVQGGSVDYTEDLELVVTWYEPAVALVDGAPVGDDVARRALQAANTITDRLRTYATTIPGFAPQTEATLTQARYGLVEGMVWMAEARMRVRTWS
jgi:hypothetical protein